MVCMSKQVTMIDRVSRWFRQRFMPQDDLPLLYGQTQTPGERVRRFGFPWRSSQSDGDLSVLQSGLTSMTTLMTSLRHYLDQQSARHDELLNYLSQLSSALQAIPDASRVQGETLRVLHQQIAYQNAQHKLVAEMLRKMTESTGTQHEIVELLRDRVETLYKNDQQIAQTIEGMGSAITVVTQNSQTNTMVLDRLRDNLVTRDGDLERSIRRQNRWIISTLLVAIFMSFTAIVVVIIVSMWSLGAISRVADSASVRPMMSPTFNRALDGPQGMELTLHPGETPKNDAPADSLMPEKSQAVQTLKGPSFSTTIPATQEGK